MAEPGVSEPITVVVPMMRIGHVRMRHVLVAMPRYAVRPASERARACGVRRRVMGVFVVERFVRVLVRVRPRQMQEGDHGPQGHR